MEKGRGNKDENNTGFTTLDLQETLHQRGNEIEQFFKLSERIHGNLSKEVIAIVIELIEAGIDPESIAAVIQEIRK